MTKYLRQAFRKQRKSTQQTRLQIAGTLGIPIGGKRKVEVTGRNNFVYVKLRDNPNEVIQAFNNKVAPSYDLPVIVERQGNRYVIVSVDTIRYQSNWNSFAPFLPRHGNTHSFNPEGGGGGDIAWMYSRQFMPILAMPSGSDTGPNVVVGSHVLHNADGSFKYVGNTGTQDLLPYKPTNVTGAVMVLVYLDSVSGNPYLIVGSGSYFPGELTGSSQIAPYIPSIDNPNYIPLAAVRLVSGTSTIGWDNIYDVRQWVGINITGSAGSSLTIQDEGVTLGVATMLNFVGENVEASLVGSTARIFITGSTGVGISNLTGTSIGTPNAFVLTNSSGYLYTDPQLKWNYTSGKLYAEFGANVAGKETNAGRQGYQLFDSDYDIVGAGTGVGNRWVRIYDNIRASTLQGQHQNLSLLSTYIYMNATGSEVPPINAPELTFPTGSDWVLGLDSQNNSNSVRFTLNSFLPTAENNSNDVFRVDAPSGTSTFVGTIATLPGGSTLTYNVTSGNESVMVPATTSQLAKMRLWNTTRNTYALISNCAISTNTITLTASVPAGWIVGDTITVASQTVSGGGTNWIDLELTSGVMGKGILFVDTFTRSNTSGDTVRYHPLEAFGAGKISSNPVQTASTSVYNVVFKMLKITGNVFCIGWAGTWTTLTDSIIVREVGYGL